MRLNLSRRLVNGLAVYVCTIRRFDRLRFCYLFQFPLCHRRHPHRQVLWTLTSPVMLQSRHFSHACNVRPLLGTSTILAHWLKFIVFSHRHERNLNQCEQFCLRARTHSLTRTHKAVCAISFLSMGFSSTLPLTPFGRRSTFSFAHFVAYFVYIIIFYDCGWHICVCPMRQQNNWKFTNESFCWHRFTHFTLVHIYNASIFTVHDECIYGL